MKPMDETHQRTGHKACSHGLGDTFSAPQGAMKPIKEVAFIALYGRVRIPKAYCPNCQKHSFVVDGLIQCCEIPTLQRPEFYKREIQAISRRKKLPEGLVRGQLIRQGYKCFYCGRSFGTYILKKGIPLRLLIHCDHQIPFSYLQDNNPLNFILACQICNSLKSDLYFESMDEAKNYLNNRWNQKGYL